MHNPHQVFLIRGNHEDHTCGAHKRQFQQEIIQKYPNNSDLVAKKIARIYNFLPVAIFIGVESGQQTDYVLCCHGFLELGYHPAKLFNALALEMEDIHFEKLGLLKREAYVQMLPTHIKRHIKNLTKSNKGIFACHPVKLSSTLFPYHLGFTWNHLIYNNEDEDILYFSKTNHESRPWHWGKYLAHAVLKIWTSEQNGHRSLVHWVFRSHQHLTGSNYQLNPVAMRSLWKNNGIFNAWKSDDESHSLDDIDVFTLQVAPDNIYSLPQGKYPGFNYDTFVIVTTAKNKENWKLEIINKTMFQQEPHAIEIDGKSFTPQKPFKEK